MAKICTKCGLERPLSAYHRYSKENDKLRPSCKACGNKANHKWAAENPRKAKEATRKWRQAHPERVRAFSRGSYRREFAKNPEKFRERKHTWAAENPRKAKEAQKRWAKENPGKVNARQAQRRAAKKQAMPAWLSESQLSEIRQIYIDCPKGWHVDHIVPLQGATVSGLHLPCNLQHLPASENLRKSNKLEV